MQRVKRRYVLGHVLRRPRGPKFGGAGEPAVRSLTSRCWVYSSCGAKEATGPSGALREARAYLVILRGGEESLVGSTARAA